MLIIILAPILGLLLAMLLTQLFPKAMFKGYDVLPFFLIFACEAIARQGHRPSFLPYGFLFYFIGVIIISLHIAVINKNLSLSKTFRKLWNFLVVCSVFWYVGLLFITLI
ncbi:DUF3397 family protein [Lactobacillus psittaci]|uniref:Uncharacterized protein n=1 Tax=Lactobacillus psittaci DSM 15354 TaxID=1122152 RepID=A0A0R1SBL5_9LACO|nr:DUF3397 family protein [Lactobacillus psittaci]KRL63464.1 hypothetical protein FC23_GL000706 [Lactobacillus psittaci DSM 15354]